MWTDIDLVPKRLERSGARDSAALVALILAPAAVLLVFVAALA